MRLRQSDLKAWARCPLAWRYANVDDRPRSQNGSSVFGSVIHDCILYLETTRDLEGALIRFEKLWVDPTVLRDDLRIDYYVRGTNWTKFKEEGLRILRDWWSIVSWESDIVLAREQSFEVPVGDHTLVGTVDKLVARMVPKIGGPAIVVVDYKTNRKLPTYDYLGDDLQFTAYALATTNIEFWRGLDLADPDAMFARFADAPRFGEWVALTGPKRMDAGLRTQVHYNRLAYAIDAMAASIDARVFVPNISGETCRYCEYRDLCGLQPIG